MIDGVEYKLTINDGENHLHGGLDNWSKVCCTKLVYIPEFERMSCTSATYRSNSTRIPFAEKTFDLCSEFGKLKSTMTKDM